MFVCDEDIIGYEDPSIQIAVRYMCRAWTCPKCGPRRKAQLVAIGLAGDPKKLLTLPAKPKPDESPVAMAKRLSLAWRRLHRKMKRWLNIPKLPHFTVVERHDSGFPHLHILLRCAFIPQRWLSQQWKIESGSKIVDIRDVAKRRNIVGYVTKYLGKDPHKFGTTKRYWRSQDWCPKTPAEEREKLFLGHKPKQIKEHIRERTQRIVASGWRIDRISPDHVRAYSPLHPLWDTAGQ